MRLVSVVGGDLWSPVRLVSVACETSVLLFVGLEFVSTNDTHQWHPLCYPLSPSLQPTGKQERKVI